MNSNINLTLFRVLAMAGIFLGLSANSATAQDWRLSGSYNIHSVGFNYVPNQFYSGSIGAASKGVLEIELERYLLYRLYVAGKAEYLLHNQQELVIGGPVDYQQFNLGALAGIQWPKIGVYGGVKVGRVSDFKILSSSMGDNSSLWVEPVESANRFTSSFTGGIKYYLLNFVHVKAEITRTYNLPQGIIPQSSLENQPAFRSFDFSPISFSVGISISIPWNKRRTKGGVRDYKLPPLMKLSGISFGKPMDNTFVTSPFGPRWSGTHKGVDLDADIRDKIYAAEQGVVIKAGKGRGYGKMVRIKHSNGFETVYAHMNRISVKEGQRVRKGQEVGQAGNTGTSTGVHLHFEVIKDGKAVNPLSYVRF